MRSDNWLIVGLAVLGSFGCNADEPGARAVDVEGAPNVTHEASAREALRAVERFAGVLPGSVLVGVRRDGTWLAPEMPAGAAPSVEVRLAARSRGAFRIVERASGGSIEVSSPDFRETEAEFAHGYVVYRGAGPDGGEVFHRVTRAGTEDHVVVNDPATEPKLDYEVALGEAIVGLRLVEDTLEFLDRGGAPRLRVSPPHLVDAKGERREASLAVRGCEYDTDPRGPWGRPVKDPGARRCTVEVRWNREGVAYPILVDPAWVSTGSMVWPRSNHGAHLLPSGKVLALMGYTGTGWCNTDAADLYDPASGTWSPTASVPKPLCGASQTLLSSGDVLVAGGREGALEPTLANAYVYQWSSGTWAQVGDMLAPHQDHGSVLLPTGKVLILSGTDAELYDAGVWSPAASSLAPHDKGTHTVLLSGEVLFAGGYGASGWHRACETYDPVTDTWSPRAKLNDGRAEHQDALLTSGRVLVVGAYMNNAEIYDPAANTWTAISIPEMGGNLTVDYGMSLTRLPAGGALWMGGMEAVQKQYNLAWIFDDAQNAWKSAGTSIHARYQPATTLLPSGDLLVTGGQIFEPNVDPIHPTDAVEIWSGDPQGSPCETSSACALGFTCSDGFCCNAACDGACDVCASALGATADGTCTPLPLGHPGSPACGALACDGVSGGCPSSCADDDVCVGPNHCNPITGECIADFDVAHACDRDAQCLSGHCVDGVCCDTACVGACQACSASLKASGGGEGTCGDAKAGSDPHDTCPDEGAGACLRNGACDGFGACQLYAEGTPCAPVDCVGNAPASFRCDGEGTCAAVLGVDCGAAACAAGICPSSCVTSGDCVETAFCEAGTCAPRHDLGAACQIGDECTSGLCVDGVCCNAPCQGPCEACAEPGKAGTCLPVVGAPRGDREPCPGGSGGDVCGARSCDGTERASCAGFVGPEISCRAAGCADGIVTLAGHCGGGICPPAQTKSCAPFACGGDACKTACASDGDCAFGFGCDVDAGKCISIAVCNAEGTGIIQGGVPGSIDCSPYRCEAGACKISCASVDDCAEPFACNAAGDCVPRPKDVIEFGGCSFSQSRGGSSELVFAVLLGILGLGARRKARAAACSGMALLGSLSACSNARDEATTSEAREPATNDVEAFARWRDVLSASSRELDHEKRDASAARVELAERASGGFRLEDPRSGAAIGVVPRGLRDSEATLVDGYVVHRGAGPGGGDVLHRITQSGVEDFVVLDRRPREPALDYEISLGEKVSALRLVGSTLELLDGEGAPRLRVSPPFVVDAKGERRDARIHVMNCAYDADPRPPWGRDVTPPGARTCTARVAWDDRDLEYPVLVDPLWTSTASMAIARQGHTATLLASGHVLVVGGPASATLAELYDPDTDTWAATGSTSMPHILHTASQIDSNNILVVGGAGASLASVEMYDASTGTFTDVAPLPEGRFDHRAAVVELGGHSQVFVLGGTTGAIKGYLASTARFDPQTLTWTVTASMSTPRQSPGASPVANGKEVLVTGGKGQSILPNSALSSCESYDVETDTWSAAPPLAGGMYDHRQSTLPSGKVLVTGSRSLSLPSVQIFDPITDTWSLQSDLARIRTRHTATVLDQDRVLIVGGTYGNPPSSYAEILDLNTGISELVSDMTEERAWHTATLLPSGAVLVAGGNNLAGYATASTERFAFLTAGSTCVSSAECESGLFCVDSICCDSPCDGSCQACRAQDGAVADGTCTLLADGSPGIPACGGVLCNGTDASCPTSCAGDEDCATTHHCDAGSCVLDILAGNPCASDDECITGHCVEGVCCDTACNGKCVSCVAVNKGAGSDGTCGLVAAGTDPRDSCPDDGALSCQRDGTCDANGSCSLYPAGTSCKPATCVDNTPVAHLCDGIGACAELPGDACGPSACKSGACTSGCSVDSDCLPNAFCDSGQCAAKSGDGSACDEGRACLSGSCVDGVCCNSACDGQCEACAEPGAEGICVPVSGEPRGGRSGCDAGDPGAPCSARTCDGFTRDHCEGFPGASVSCAAAACTDGVLRLASACDGAGACAKQTELPCEPFACDPNKPACQSSCATADDCAPGYACLDGACIIGAFCESDTILREADGSARDCAPYRCSGGRCLEVCADIADCAPEYVCNTEHACVSFEQDSDLLGCACATAGAPRERSSGAAGLFLVGLAFALRARRRGDSARQNE